MQLKDIFLKEVVPAGLWKTEEYKHGERGKIHFMGCALKARERTEESVYGLYESGKHPYPASYHPRWLSVVCYCLRFFVLNNL